MNGDDNFTNLQRFNSTVMAKYEWTTSRIGMQKTGEEVHDRRTKTYRKANEFLQGLLQKRSDVNSIDDNGTIDRYHKFLKYKINSHHDDNTLDEFDRRLRALNQHKQTSKLNQSNTTITTESNSINTQTMTDESEHLTSELVQYFNNEKQSKPYTNTSSINTTDHSVSSTVFFDDSEITLSLNTEENQSLLSSSLSLEQSFTSSSNNSILKPFYKPIPRRADGSEIKTKPIENPLPTSASSNNLLLKHCHFPRSLLSREQLPNNRITKRQLPSAPIQQFDKNQLFNLLDRLDNDYSCDNFTIMLDQLTLSSTSLHSIDDSISTKTDDDDDDECEHNEINLVIPNLFDQSVPLPDYYKISTYHVDDPKNISLYTMTIGIVQLSSSRLVPYSILNGRRPVLTCSIETNFKKVRSKRQKDIYQVTAIELLTDTDYLQENDIILKVNYQTVYHLPTDTVRDILHRCRKNSNDCLLTIARLCQPRI